MKQIGFSPKYIEDILSGKKTITYRYGEKYFKLFKPHEVIEVIDSSTGKVSALIKVKSIRLIPLSQIPLNKKGHESYTSTEDVISKLQAFYPNHLNHDSLFTSIEFLIV